MAIFCFLAFSISKNYSDVPENSFFRQPGAGFLDGLPEFADVDRFEVVDGTVAEGFRGIVVKGGDENDFKINRSKLVDQVEGIFPGISMSRNSRPGFRHAPGLTAWSTV